MTNWQHFKKFYEAWKPWLNFPRLKIVRAEDIEDLRNNPHTVALYEPKDNTINILFEHRKNKAIFLHECGHWINLVIYASLEILWEFIWWGCSLRNIFVKRI
jgi:hypothetical protein